MKANDLFPGVVFSSMAGFLAYVLFTPYEQPSRDVQAPAARAIPASVVEFVEPQYEIPRFAPGEADIRSVIDDLLDTLRGEIQAMLDAGDHLEARAHLIERAALANSEGDKKSLGYVLALLGEVSIESRDLAAAGIYLVESLSVFDESGDTVGQAYAYMQLGRMHIESRAIARHASDAYNLILLARFQMTNYQDDAAEANLREAIGASLDIDRFGTAASALESLARLQAGKGLTSQSEESLFRAAELYAACGQAHRAAGILDKLAAQGVDRTRIDENRRTVAEALETFEIDTGYVRQARDYRSLYYQYRHAGDEKRAWSFRIRAAQVLAQSSKRAMYYRQPDVMALLYESNFAMINAESFVEHAAMLFASQGAEDMARSARNLTSLIF